MSAGKDPTAPAQSRQTRPQPFVNNPGAHPGAPAGTPPPAPSEPGDLVEQELLVEDVSIDGMCGVY